MSSNSVSFKSVFRRLFLFMKPYRKKLMLSLLLTILAAFFSSLSPWIVGKATDAMVYMVERPGEESVRAFAWMVAMVACSHLAYALFKYLGSVLLARVSQKSIYDLREKVDRKMKKLPVSYFDSNAHGDILSRMTNDVDIIANSLQQSLDQMVTSVTAVIFILGMMLWINPILTLIGVLTIPLAIFVSMVIAKSSQKYFKMQQAMLGDLNGYVEEIYNGHSIVSAFGMEKESIRRFEEKNEALYESAWKAQFISSTLMPITQGMSNLGYVAVVVVSGWLVIQGRMTVGMTLSFIQYLRQFSQPIIQTVQIANILQSTAAAAERVFEFLNEQEEMDESENPLTITSSSIDVELKNVQFGYRSDQLLMKDVNLKVEAGKMVAIVGPTGAGKTTLMNLLLRFYDVNGGSILIDNKDIRQMKRSELRSVFGMVLQDTWLFTGSIMDNIRYGRLDATDEEVFAAAKAARADFVINALPGGYQFRLQENASNLAQGERQLITIARAILSNRPILILDEATSSVDTRTEVLIQEAMRTLMKGRTAFVIAHRLSTIREADQIVYMENGDIRETGSHEELLEKGGSYAKLYYSQFADEPKSSPALAE